LNGLFLVAIENAILAGILSLLVFSQGKVCRRAPLLHALWVVVLFRLFLPPIFTPAWSWTGKPGANPTDATAPAEPPPAASAPAAVPPRDAAVIPTQEHHLPGSPALPSVQPRPPALATVATWTWVFGAIAVLFLAAARTWSFERIVRSATAAPAAAQEEARRLAARLGLRRPPGVWLLPRTLSPALWVLGRRRRLVFPAELWGRLKEDEQQCLLLHELAHLRRRDHWVRWLELAAMVVYWWHPAVWWTRREIERHEEECCDAWVTWAAPEARNAYGKALITTIEFLAGGSEALPALANGMAGVRVLHRRLNSILKWSAPRRISAPGWILLAGVGVACLLHVPVAARPQEPDGKVKDAEAKDRSTRDDSAAARSGLDWLVRHQSPDGSWQAAGFRAQCKAPCRNADPARYGEGLGSPAYDVGVMGLAIVAFTSWGYTHRDGARSDYAAAIGKAVGYLKRVQARSDDPNTSGRYGEATHEHWIYNHAIATEALARLLAISRDRDELLESVERAVQLCLRAQNDGWGWRYGIRPGENDSSVTARMVFALRAARDSGFEARHEQYQSALAGARSWFARVTAATGRSGYMAPGDEGSRLAAHRDPYPYSKDLPVMTAASVISQLFAGETRNAESLRKGVDLVLLHLPAWREPQDGILSTINFCYWHFASLALFQYGGEPWRLWKERMGPMLIAEQRRGEAADERGSWDPIDEWGPAGGRVYSTAFAVTTLAVGASR
jgi:beta-lactamase regulating signal transducer with metallopeptidase domain